VGLGERSENFFTWRGGNELCELLSVSFQKIMLLNLIFILILDSFNLLALNWFSVPVKYVDHNTRNLGKSLGPKMLEQWRPRTL
jgi:hypothetical protein